MISYQQGKPHLYPLTRESSLMRLSLRDRPVEDFAVSAEWLHLQKHFSLLPYVVDLESQIVAMRAALEALERERDELLAMPNEEEPAISFPLEIVSTRPARIVGEVEAQFYYFGEESEE